MTLLSTLFRWAVKNGHMSSNPAEGLSLDINQRPDEERKAYSNDDLCKIVRHLPKSPEKKFIPLIALYSGMRLDEICQLTTEDIKVIDGITCFDVNNCGDKKLKSKSSLRIVPVHPVLVGYGLLEYVAGKKETSPIEANLWGYKKNKWGYGTNMTRWWSAHFIRKFVTSDPLKCFHSFRHTFTNCLKQNGVNETVIAELVGHSVDSITVGRYGKRYRVDILLKAIKMLSYEITHTLPSPPAN